MQIKSQMLEGLEIYLLPNDYHRRNPSSFAYNVYHTF